MEKTKIFQKKTTSYRNVYDPNIEKGNFDGKIHDYEQSESGCSFDSLMKRTIKVFSYHDNGVFGFCLLLKPYCDSKSLGKRKDTKDNVCFLWCFVAPVLKVGTHHKRVTHFKINSLNLV